jgi:hypothetical protein
LDPTSFANEIAERIKAEPLLKYFGEGGLNVEKQAISDRFLELAIYISVLPRNPERTVALRKLMEARDQAMRVVV